MGGHEWENYFNTLAAQSCVALAGFFLLGGVSLFQSGRQFPPGEMALRETMSGRHRWTLTLLGIFVIGVIGLGVPLAVAAILTAAALPILRLASKEDLLRNVPWGVLLMACGVTVLVGVVEESGGMALFSGGLAVAGPDYVTGVMGFVTGLVSVYSSSSGVVIPAFMPSVPGIVERLGDTDPLMLAYSINVGSHLVDVSPLSALGALCLAAVPSEEDRRIVFRKVMAWGLSMTVVGGLICQLFFGYR